MDLHEEPEPCRARMDSCFLLRFKPAAEHAANVSDAEAEADEANPAPIGKLVSDATFALRLVLENFLIKSKCFVILSLVFTSADFPFSVIESLLKSFENSTVVVVVRPSKVIDMLEFIGKNNCPSAFPQYFMSAILEFATAVDFIIGYSDSMIIRLNSCSKV